MPHSDSFLRWDTVTGPRTCRRLHGELESRGYAVEWRAFSASRPVDWAGSFTPGSVEFCLNFGGSGEVQHLGGNIATRFAPSTVGYYSVGRSIPPEAARFAGRAPHEFLVIGLDQDYLRDLLEPMKLLLRRPVREKLFGNRRQRTSPLADVQPMTLHEKEFARQLQAPPVPDGARDLWYESKIAELTAMQLFEPDPANDDFFCVRQKRLAQERVGKAKAFLAANLAEPLDLKALGHAIGCSSCYLSRTFSDFCGMTISRYLRALRIEEAARLLAGGRFNVTEAALEVGYNSLSHFSKAFYEEKGCLPSHFDRQSLQG